MGSQVKQEKLLTSYESSQLKSELREYYARIKPTLINLNSNERKFGIEAEYAVLDKNFQVSRCLGEHIVQTLGKNDKRITNEMGSFQVETVVGPFDLSVDGIHQAFGEMLEVKGKLSELACKNGAGIIGIGLIPKIDLEMFLDPSIITRNPRYQISSQYFKSVGSGNCWISTKDNKIIPLRDEKGLTIINSIHLNLQALNADDLVSLFNYSQMLASPIISLSANSGIVNGDELTKLNYQTTIFEQCDRDYAKGAPRAGFYPGYLKTIDDYFNTAFSFNPIYTPSSTDTESRVQELFMLQCGSYFPWVRIKVGDDKDHLRIEFRPIPMQPTSKENIAVALFYVCSVLDMAGHKEELLPYELVKLNNKESMKHGMGASIYEINQGIVKVPVAEHLERLLCRAEQYAEQNNLTPSKDFFSPLKARIHQSLSPAQKLILETKKGSFDTALEEYVGHCATEMPYIDSK